MFRSGYSASLCCSVYCLCVNVYCTTATGCQTQLQLTNIYHILTYSNISYGIRKRNFKKRYVDVVRFLSAIAARLCKHDFSRCAACGRTPAEIVGSNPTGAWIFVCCECRVLSGRGLCDELITRPEESYRLRCVVVCDLETSRMGAPYIYMTLVA